jgi:ABC-2 type transport system ATP-binding protein
MARGVADRTAPGGVVAAYTRRVEDALLAAEGLTKRYGSTIALDDATFAVGGGITGLLGANGAGKSTAIKCFAGLIRPDAGRATFDGRSLSASPEARERLGYMPEHDCLPDHASGAAFLSYMAQLSGLPPAHARIRASDVLRHVGLAEERHRPIGTYSTGMKQRLKLAQALVHDPAVALLDEPTAGLDPTGRREMLELVARIGHELGISILLSTHHMGDVERTCDRIVVLDSGRIVHQGAVGGFAGETEALAVTVSERHDALVDELRARGLDPRREGGTIVIDRPGAAEYDAIRDALVASGAPLHRMAPLRHALDELFREPVPGSVVPDREVR